MTSPFISTIYPLLVSISPIPYIKPLKMFAHLPTSPTGSSQATQVQVFQLSHEDEFHFSFILISVSCLQSAQPLMGLKDSKMTVAVLHYKIKFCFSTQFTTKYSGLANKTKHKKAQLMLSMSHVPFYVFDANYSCGSGGGDGHPLTQRLAV